jgi:hypothetical protein
VAALPVLLQALAQLPRDKPPYSSVIDRWLEQLCIVAGLLPTPLLQQQQQQQQQQSSATAHSRLRLARHTRAQLALSFTAVDSTIGDSHRSSDAPAAASVLVAQQLAVLRKRQLQRLLARGFLRCSSHSSSSSSKADLVLQLAQLDYVKRLHNGQRELKAESMIRPPTVPLNATLDEVVLLLAQLYAAVKQAVSTDAQQQGACSLAREAVRACTAVLGAHLPRSYAALAARPLSTLNSNSSNSSSSGTSAPTAAAAATSNAARYGYKPKAAATNSVAATAATAAAAVAVPDDGSAALRVVDLGGRCAAVGHFANAVALLLAAALFSALAHGERSSELQQQLQQCEQQLLAACSSNGSAFTTATDDTAAVVTSRSSSVVLDAQVVNSVEDFVLVLNTCAVSSCVHARDKLKDILAQRADLQQ